MNHAEPVERCATMAMEDYPDTTPSVCPATTVGSLRSILRSGTSSYGIMSFVADLGAVVCLVSLLIAGILRNPGPRTGGRAGDGILCRRKAAGSDRIGVAALLPLALFLAISAYNLGRMGRYEQGLPGRPGHAGYVLGQIIFFLITPFWWSLI